MSGRFLGLGVAGLFLLSLPAQGGGICSTDTSTLLRVHANRSFIARSIRLPPPPFHLDEEYVVTLGGAGVVIRTERRLCCDFKVTRTFASGLARPAAFRTFTNALAANHVEEQTSCVFENDLTPPGGVRVLGTYEVSWYGEGGRENSFQIVFADPGGSTLPLCGAEAGALVDAVRTFADAVAAVHGNRVCTP
ncbi:MAG TPA: hypothetical protein VF173_00640 [Thermoanaerobaculia bacterium]|nr:hypothetical protein [Thermoanaerobaculia bacterium]